ncbi:S1 family peptidase [Aneurinibacillus sp. REN35]|uniref:S1 family peptidase n=2 Tax=Paenibacillaceae TaxID=186822 RepID=UPI003529C835
MIIEKNIARIECGNESGTGFLIQNNLVLTALHTVSDYTSNPDNILITFPYSEFSKGEMGARVIDQDEDFDIALLELNIEFENDNCLNINISKTAENEKWETFGFPVSKWTSGAKLTGYILRSNIENDQLLWDTDLNYEQQFERFDGFSGSPLVVGGYVKGIILQKLDGTVAAISTFKIKRFLDKNNIVYENVLESDLPHINSNIEDIELLVNTTVVIELEKKFDEQAKGYILLKGSPGSGKSTLIAEYKTDKSNVKVLGKYLIRNKHDGLPVSFKSSEIVFAEWLERILWNELYVDMPPKRDRKLHEWIIDIQKLFILLSQKLMKNGKKGTIFIDGIEDVYFLNKIQDFFSVLPEELPSNILIVLACQNEEFLPTLFKSRINEENIVKVVPLAANQTRFIVNNRLREENFSLTIKEAIAMKSEGHPLYLRYLIEESIQLKDEKIINQWLNQIPYIEGDIRVYYESMWQRVQESPNELYILATISRLREPVDEIILRKVLPSHIGNMLIAFLPKMRHLLDIDECIAIYHSSFANFIVDKTKIMSQDIHYQITLFCKEQDNHLYSIKNILFHMLRQTEDLRIEAIIYCNQKWADKCTTYHIEPDLIVSDLNEAIDFALSNKIEIKETIRLLLLAQRIKFRYNNLFAKYAVEFANLLIQKKQFNEAMKYIVRQGFLIIEDDNAIDFLIKFLENHAFEEAQEIFQILRHRLILAMDLGEISYKAIDSYFKALSIVTSYQADDPEYEFSKEYKFLISQLEYISDENKANYMEFCLLIASYHRAFLIFNRDIYKSIEVYEKQGLPIDSNMIRILSFTLIELLNLEKVYGKKENLPGKIKLLEDIKYVFGKFDVNNGDHEIVLTGLIDNKFEVNIIEKLIQDMNIGNTRFHIRESNGVDLNYKSIYIFSMLWQYRGFNNYGDKYPEIVKSTSSTWEEFLESIISLVSYIKGKAWRERCLDTESECNELADILKNILFPVMGFDLKERSSWKRSYLLVEDALVYVYREIAEFYKEYCPTRVLDFLDFLMDKLEIQLGMYTEGFRESIFSIIDVLKGTKGTKRKIYDLSKGLEKHILLGVQNRWERTEDLIKLVNIYAYLENDGSVQRVFQELLNTSMGPSWYKEDQLSLIKSSLVNLQQSNEIESYLPTIASILEYASGEMTFQRYVRVEKEEFIGGLCKVGNLSNAIEFLKEQISPLPKVLQEKVESPQIDYVDRGKGYKFGVGNLEEQNAILEILDSTQDMNPLLKWGFCELFLIGDMRYLNRFAYMMADIICKSDAVNERGIFFNRLLKIFISDMTQNERDTFLKSIKCVLPQEIYNDLLELIKINNIAIEVEEIKDTIEDITIQQMTSEHQEGKNAQEELFFPGTFGKKSSLEESNQAFLEATEEMYMDNNTAAKEKFIEGLKILQEGGWQIWSGTVSTEANQAFRNLAKICDEQDLVIAMRTLILDEEYAQDWQIVQKILDLIGSRFGESDATEILKVIIEHLNLMVRPPEELNEYYHWLNNKKSSKHFNVELAQLFVWYLNSPLTHIKYRGPEILKALTRINPNFFIPVILDYSLNIYSGDASEICAGIIYSLALEDINLVWMYVNHEYTITRIKECEHFTIKYTFMKILGLGGVNLSVSDNSSVREMGIYGLEVDEEFWRSKNSMFTILEKLNCWNKDDYKEMEKHILENNKELDITDLIRIDDYLSLAYEKQGQSGILESETYKAINKVLVKKVYDADALKIFRALNRVNPTFPAEQIRLSSKPSKGKEIEEFILGKSGPEKFLYEGKYEHIHYTEILYSEEERCFKSVEIIAFLRKNEDVINDEFDFNAMALKFKVNDFPDFRRDQVNTTSSYRPLIYKGELETTYYGGTFTPAYLNKDLDILSNVNERDITSESWIEGRSWDTGKVGMPLREGSRLLISKEIINSIKETGWKLVWYVNYNDENAFIIDREKREIVSLW